MKGQIYEAFVKAGFEKEARQLSTTKEGKVVPALGHYISAADNILRLEKQFSDRVLNTERKTSELYDLCAEKILNYIYLHKSMGEPPIRISLLNSLEQIFHKGKAK